MPALPLHEAGKYVAGAYVVFVAMILIYVVIMAIRLQRIEREVAELDELAARKAREEPGDREENLGGPDAARLSQSAGLEAPRR